MKAKADEIKAPHDNLLVKSSETYIQNVDVVIHIASDASDEGIVERGEAIIIDLMKIDKNRELNKLYRDDLVYALKKILQPTRNLALLIHQLNTLRK